MAGRASTGQHSGKDIMSGAERVLLKDDWLRQNAGHGHASARECTQNRHNAAALSSYLYCVSVMLTPTVSTWQTGQVLERHRSLQAHAVVVPVEAAELHQKVVQHCQRAVNAAMVLVEHVQHQRFQSICADQAMVSPKQPAFVVAPGFHL